ncbi:MULTISPECIES: hypothetical protein [unclassified Streptomyces]|uniref:hypothetical protein n=1 Tax=unclassified Streptomyces TaxID=2593676 RepID=UPI000DADAEC1|nr:MULTISPECIES: hypothetical protein [unclassified Streptomyces]PZT83251.1 hypothetical protein DNK56_15320 [Streptomyces sp. AC1-42W]
MAEFPGTSGGASGADQEIMDDALGVFTRTVHSYAGGQPEVGPFYTSTCELDGRRVAFLIDTIDPTEVRRLLPRLRQVVEWRGDLKRRAVEAVVHAFSQGAATAEDLAEAHDDLLLDTIVAESNGDVLLHLTDSCGGHMLDGYWPAVRFDRDDTLVKVTIEA